MRTRCNDVELALASLVIICDKFGKARSGGDTERPKNCPVVAGLLEVFGHLPVQGKYPQERWGSRL
jgi:hypothetical protein